ncbi:hypothetical protein VPFG_00158 [Vibrio phage nt-1]|uniref:Uncharacterized protein n=1 Tax=Vibrio phage nt-1 TaxID=115992 RepID=R9TIF8_9CAUD|nr:hypothetical protein VPFG_00158 [Vibrio phage nt-1]AGN30160.1 hypothetical protein VPFG_00158 [Vibrio phage nt-1]
MSAAPKTHLQRYDELGRTLYIQDSFAHHYFEYDDELKTVTVSTVMLCNGETVKTGVYPQDEFGHISSKG